MIPWAILEPNPTPTKECKAEIIKGFFDEKFKFFGIVDTIVHSHVFEHIYNPSMFVKHLSDFLKVGSKLIFSVPNMGVMLERKYTNCLNFEHTIFLSEIYIETLLARHGFRVLEKEYFLDDHSIFFSAVREKDVDPIQLPNNLYFAHKKLYLDYLDFHQKLVNDINHRLSEYDEGNAFLFGAHVQAQYLIGFGLNTNKIKAILDNDPNKHGKRLFGTDKIVFSPTSLKEEKSPLVIIRAGTFTNEIVSQIKLINPETQFLL